MITILSAAILSLAVAGGLLLGVLHARHVRTPFAAGIGHAMLALAGVVTLAVAVWSESQPAAVNVALLLFVIALIGGVFILLFRLQRESPPGFMIVLHGGTAAIALAVLWLGIVNAG